MNVLAYAGARRIGLPSWLTPKDAKNSRAVFASRTDGTATEIVSGADEILAMQDLLVERSVAFGQAGAMDHLPYFLDWASALKKTPHLVLLGATRQQALADPPSLQGALLLFEYKLRGRGTRVFATDDTTGRRTLLAPADRRRRMAKLGAETLMRRGAGVVLVSFADSTQDAFADLTEDAMPDAGGKGVPRGPRRWRMAMRRREIPAYLPLEPVFDATLGRMGQKTRANLRYYRKRAEAQLGAHFVPAAEIGREEFLNFNRHCTYAVNDQLAGWRYDAVRPTPGMFIAGVRGGDGGWLSLVGARRYRGFVEIDWQMNRRDLPAASLGTVMRSFLIEHEGGAGMRRLYIEGGTPHAMQHSFATDAVRDLLVLRRGMMAPVLRRVGGRLAPKTNFVLDMLAEPKLAWKRWS